MTRWPSAPPLASALPPPGPLPLSYRLDATRDAKQQFLEPIIDGLLSHPGVYWGKQRSREVIRRQVKRCQGVCLLHRAGDGVKELAGWARVVTDGEG